MICAFSDLVLDGVRLYLPFIASGLYVKETPPYTPPSHFSFVVIANTHGVAKLIKAGASDVMPKAPTFLHVSFTYEFVFPSLFSFTFVTNSPLSAGWLNTVCLTFEPFQSFGSMPGRVVSPTGLPVQEKFLLVWSVFPHAVFQFSNPSLGRYCAEAVSPPDTSRAVNKIFLIVFLSLFNCLLIS